MFVVKENIACVLKTPSLIAKIGKMKKSKFGRIDSTTTPTTDTEPAAETTIATQKRQNRYYNIANQQICANAVTQTTGQCSLYW